MVYKPAALFPAAGNGFPEMIFVFPATDSIVPYADN